MSKNSKSFNKTVIKLIAVVCIIGLSLGVGVSQIGIERLLNADSVEEIFNITQEVLNENMKGDYTQDSGEDVYESENLPDVNGEFDVYYFYVGQADCTLICCDGEYMLIDAGNNEDGALIVSQLESMGIESFKYIVGTHPHEDHIGGIDNIINNFEIENLFMPDFEYDSATYRQVVTAAKKKNLDVVEPEIGHIFYVGDAKCEVMGVDSDSEETNQTSIIIEVAYGNNTFLFMADAEIPNEEKRLWNDVDVLKVGHHGSSTSSSDDFLEQVSAEVAVVSCGVDNSYGHPHKEVVEALEDWNAKMYRTDTQGTIHVQSDGKNYEVMTLDVNLDGND